MKTNIFKRWSARGLAAAALLALSQNASAAPVDLELSLVIDISGSVDATEYALQRDGYAAAFQSAAISNIIQDLGDAGTGGIAVNVIFFSTTATQRISWTQLDSAADSAAFGAAIGALLRTPPNLGTQTDIAAGMNTSVASFTNSFEGSRLVMDVSGDGQQNDSCSVSCTATVQAARDAAAAAGITVNGLAIAGLKPYFDANVITSDGFTIAATNFNDFARAAQEKIFREITGVPEPTVMMLLGLGLAGFGFSRKRRNR